MPHVDGHSTDPFWIQNDRTPSESPLDSLTQQELESRMAGDYLIEKLELKSPNVDMPINLAPVYDTVSIYEDISKPYLLMDIALVESFGLRELIPIIGEEFVEIVAATRGLIAGQGSPQNNKFDGIIQKVFRVTSVSPIVSKNDRIKQYVLHCSSVEAIINEKTRVSRGYLETEISRVVRDIYEKEIIAELTETYGSYIGTERIKPIVIEPTDGIHNFAFPFKKPFDIMDDLAEKAVSADVEEAENVNPDTQGDVPPVKQTGGALFMFYETLSNFRFESLETIYKRDPKRRIYAKPMPVTRDNATMTSFNTAMEYEIDGLFDVVENLRAGMYASKLITHDSVRMRYDITGYSYILRNNEPIEQESPDDGMVTQMQLGGATPESSVKKVDDFTLSLARDGHAGKLCTDRNDLLLDKDNGERCKIKFMATDFNHAYMYERNRKKGGGGAETGIKENNLERRVQVRDSQLQQLVNIKITLRMYGDSSLRVGEIIWFYAPSQSVQEGQEEESDKFISGKFIVTKIQHNFTIDAYTMNVQIRKDAWYSDPPAFNPELNQNAQMSNTSKKELQNERLGVQETTLTSEGSDNNLTPNNVDGGATGVIP